MFITLPDHEQRGMEGLLQAKAKAWRVVELSTRLPWFVVSIESFDSRAQEVVSRDLLLAWGADIAGLMVYGTEHRIAGLGYFHRSIASDGWSLRRVRRIWKISDVHISEPGALIFQDEIGEFSELGELGEAPPYDRRELLLDLTRSAGGVQAD